MKQRPGSWKRSRPPPKRPFPFGECKICADQATGVHYGIESCEGCKGFFKRSSRVGHAYRCQFGGNCDVTPANRNRCKYCRYIKCIKLGMSFQAVKMGRVPDAIKEKAIADLHHQQVAMWPSSQGPIAISSAVADRPTQLQASNPSRCCLGELEPVGHADKDEFDQYFPGQSVNLEDMQGTRSSEVASDLTFCDLLAAFNSPWAWKKAEIYDRVIEQLLQAQRSDLQRQASLSLLNKCKTLNIVLEELDYPGKHTTREDFFKELTVSIPRCVQKLLSICDAVPGFSLISEADRAMILKEGLFEWWMMANALFFFEEESYLVLGNGHFYTRAKMLDILEKPMVDEMFAFSKRLYQFELTERMIVVLQAIVITTPGRKNVVNSVNMHQLNELLWDVLRCELTRHFDDSHTVMHHLRQVLQELRPLNDSYKIYIGGLQLAAGKDNQEPHG